MKLLSCWLSSLNQHRHVEESPVPFVAKEIPPTTPSWYRVLSTETVRNTSFLLLRKKHEADLRRTCDNACGCNSSQMCVAKSTAMMRVSRQQPKSLRGTETASQCLRPKVRADRTKEGKAPIPMSPAIGCCFISPRPNFQGFPRVPR